MSAILPIYDHQQIVVWLSSSVTVLVEKNCSLNYSLSYSSIRPIQRIMLRLKRRKIKSRPHPCKMYRRLLAINLRLLIRVLLLVTLHPAISLSYSCFRIRYAPGIFEARTPTRSIYIQVIGFLFVFL